MTKRGKGLLNNINKISEEDIKDLTKLDTLAKYLAYG